MRTEEARPVRLEDYRPPDWLVETVELDVSLDPRATRVRATLALKPNGNGAAPAPLDARRRRTEPRRAEARRRPAARPSNYVATPDRLTIAQPPQRPFRLEIETVVDPSANTQLTGLYRSGRIYCTQCEAEGFRRITYFPDRPDVMAVYTTRIEAEKAEAPVLLANGNLIASGDVPGTSRHFAVWHDPFPQAVLSVRAGRRHARLRRGPLSHHVGARRRRCASTSSPARRTAAATRWTRSSAPCAGTRTRSAANTISTSS